MKKIHYFFIILILLLIAFCIFLFTRNNSTATINKIDNKITLKVKYNIQLKDKNLMPDYIENIKDAKDEYDLLKKNKLLHLYDIFYVESNKDYKSKKIINLLPKEHIQTIKVSRFKTTVGFFETRGISTNVSNKTVKIFTDYSLSFEMCLTKLKKIYVGSDYNRQFFKEALWRLVN